MEVGAAFQPATVSSSHVMTSTAVEVGCCPESARPMRMRWTDSAMFSQDPLSGVQSGITPWANNHFTIDQLR